MNEPIQPRQKKLRLPSQQKSLRVSPLTRRKVRSPTTNGISSQTPTSDVVQTIISKSSRKNAFPTPKLNYEKSAHLRPIILHVKEKRRAKGTKPARNEPNVYIRGRKDKSFRDAEHLRTKYNCLKHFDEAMLSKRGQDENSAMQTKS